jgi:hypothetical protein
MSTTCFQEIRPWCSSAAYFARRGSSTSFDFRLEDILGALKRQAERVNDTLVAIDQKSLTAADRSKLRSHGIIVQGDSDIPEARPKEKRRRRR